jgi:solute carrier family 34 (sodium-dependent phosphate cotransporter)
MSGRSVTASARADETGATARRRRPPLAPTLRRAVALVGGLFLFVGALQLMKTGAAALGVLQPGSVLVENALSTLGLGWLGALILLSGSPVAATSLALVAAGEESGGARGLSELEGFTMLTGSRLGAAFVVLVVAVIYAARAAEGHRRAPVSTAVLALTATAVVYLPAAVLGALLLTWEPYAGLELGFPAGFVDLIDFVYGDIVEWAKELPAFVTFLAGIGVLLLAFKLIDAALPDLDDDRVARRPVWLRRKWPMFALGSAVALVTMSVSVALTILVPLVAKKMVRQEYVLPYIMGANITTLGDTMLAAFALDSPAAVRVVLAEVIAAGSLSILLLALAYPTVWSALWGTQTAITRSRTRLAVFTLGVLLVPVLTIALAAVIG